MWWSKLWIETGRPIVIRQWKFGLLRGGLITVAQICFYLALVRMELATVTSIAFTGPLFVTALSIPILGHTVGIWRWLAVLIGFGGILLVLQHGGAAFTWIAILPLCASFCYATNSVTSRVFDDDVPTAMINIYSNAGALIGSVILVTATGGYIPVTSLEDWLWLITMGAVGGTAVFCLTSAYRLADPSSLSPFEFFGIPFSFFWAGFSSPKLRLIAWYRAYI